MRKMSSILNLCYYTALSFCIAAKMFDVSRLLIIPEPLITTMIFISAALFTIKTIFSIKTRKQLLITAILLPIFLYIYLATGATFILLSFLAAIAIKDINIRNVVKIDIAIKVFFLSVHLGAFFLALLFFPSLLPAANSIGAYNLYFTNANTAPILAFWLAVDILYLSKKPSLKKYLLLSAITLCLFFIAKSRTALLCFVIFSLLHLIKNEKLLSFMSKYAYLLLAAVSFLIVNIIDKTDFYLWANRLFSSRLGYSIAAYHQSGLVVIPQPNNLDLLDSLIIDNFYVRCLVLYGVITLVLYYLPIWLLNKKRASKEKRISIISSISLFSEYIAANVGFSIPFLIIMSKALEDKKEKANEH